MTSTYDLLEFATPELSIVIPAYNEADRIGRTLDSIASFLAERSLHCEVIVVDDGSTDETPRILETYSEPVRVFRQANAGVAAARLGEEE